MQQTWTCPNCNSMLVVPDGRHFEGKSVLNCRECSSWFTAAGDPVLFEDDGGDDVPDEQVKRQLQWELDEDDDGDN